MALPGSMLAWATWLTLGPCTKSLILPNHPEPVPGRPGHRAGRRLDEQRREFDCAALGRRLPVDSLSLRIANDCSFTGCGRTLPLGKSRDRGGDR